MDYTSLLERLGLALEEAVSECAEDADRIGILFSGGLDSSLIAKLCENRGAAGKLYSTAMAGSIDHSRVVEAAGHFEYELRLKTMQKSELLSYAKRVIGFIDSRKPLDVAIGIPLFAACEAARDDGCDVVLVGQGADELFAGYHRYLRMSRDDLLEAQAKDLEKLRTSDIKRDMAIAKANSLELRVPYLNDDFARLAESIPVELRIKNGVRKFILRELAKSKGLPAVICDREKKAVQYSSGVDKTLRQLAKMEKKEMGEFLSSL